MNTLSELREQAQRAAAFRGHAIEWAAPWHGERKSLQVGTCQDCGREVHINTMPEPNGIDVAGEAVALGCRTAGLADTDTIKDVALKNACADRDALRAEDVRLRNDVATLVIERNYWNDRFEAMRAENARVSQDRDALREALQEIAGYLDLKAQGFSQEYPPDHVINLTVGRYQAIARAALAKVGVRS